MQLAEHRSWWSLHGTLFVQRALRRHLMRRLAPGRCMLQAPDDIQVQKDTVFAEVALMRPPQLLALWCSLVNHARLSTPVGEHPPGPIGTTCNAFVSVALLRACVVAALSGVLKCVGSEAVALARGRVLSHSPPCRLAHFSARLPFVLPNSRRNRVRGRSREDPLRYRSLRGLMFCVRATHSGVPWLCASSWEARLRTGCFNGGGGRASASVVAP